jgi:hypothetical protein
MARPRERARLGAPSSPAARTADFHRATKGEAMMTDARPVNTPAVGLKADGQVSCGRPSSRACCRNSPI